MIKPLKLQKIPKLHDVELGRKNATAGWKSGKKVTVSTSEVQESSSSTSASHSSETTAPRPGLLHSTPSYRYRPHWQPQWTRTHSYFAIMGGFALDTSRMSINIIEKSQTRGTLSIQALKAIAYDFPEVLPDISKRFIKDKSKANGLAKLLVCLQATWFCVQVVGRLASEDSPISLLELNTFLHAVCCLATYSAWWRKPLDVSEPELIDVSRVENHEFYARLCLTRELHCAKVGSDVGDEETYKASIIRGTPLDGPQAAIASRHGYTFSFESGDVTQDVESALQDLGEDRYQMTLRLYEQQTCYGFHLKTQCEPSTHDSPRIYAELKWVDLECLRFANDTATDATESATAEWRDMFTRTSMLDAPDETLKRLHASAKSDKSFLWSLETITWFILLLAGAIYGGIHLLAWNGPFHTDRERWLWRISGITIASPIVIIPTQFCAWVILSTKLASAGADEVVVKWLRKLGNVVTSVFLTVYALVYAAARVYIAVECFINLSHLPMEVYGEPVWSKYIPHFSAG